jgi:hypothetical protein
MNIKRPRMVVTKKEVLTSIQSTDYSMQKQSRVSETNCNRI